ncbi:hypothetical protein PybrP1_001932 [[Pythium] brassicae (nom. inval.)]|nr:hypothetical protein PybrP1_001932 [[Pythium] brassicae (nom. inval.)]
MCELNEYSQQRSLWRVAFVSALTVLPSLVAVVTLDAIPLQDLSAGWDRNITFWARVFIGTFILSFGTTLQLRTMVPAARMSSKQCAIASVFAASSFQITAILIAKFWVFPVPFVIVLGNLPWSLSMLSAIVYFIGRDRLRTDPEVTTQIKRYYNLVNSAGTFLVVFPVYSYIFQCLEGIHQSAFIIALPVMKFVLKKVLRMVLAEVEELVPVNVITVDLFSALFQAKCIQNSSSHWTTAGIIAVDAVQNIYSMRKLLHCLSDVRDLMPVSTGSADLLAHCVGLLEAPEKLNLRGLPTLELLWRCESVLLVEYVEAIVPLVSSASMAILYFLPNVQYYPGMADMSPEKLQATVAGILIYSALEFLSLVYLHVAFKWKLGLLALHQLGFVLEKNWMVIQGLLLTWMIVALSFTLVHYGNDFSFKFEWIH